MRKTQNKTKKRLNIGKIAAYVTLLFLIGLFVYYLFSIFTISLDNPLKVDNSHQYLLSQNSDDTKRTLIVMEEGSGDARKIADVYVFVTNANKKESLLIYVPGWIYFGGLEEDFGNSIPVSSFRYAGDFLQAGKGVEYAIWQIGQLLGIKVDDYIWFTPEGMDNYVNLYGDVSGVEERLRQYYTAPEGDSLNDSFFKIAMMSSQYSFLKNITNIKDLYQFQNTVYTSYGFTRFLNFFAQFNSTVQNTETNGIDLSYYKYSEESLSVSGGQVRYINTGTFDEVYRGLMSKLMDRALEKERARIEVYNGSGVTGAAQQFGRKIENAGCDVVRYENAPKTEERTIVYISNKENYVNSLSIVSEVLAGSYNLVEGRPNFMTTGDIVVVLGQDVKQMYSF